MITYNTSEPRLTLPEYGRNIQRMIDHCVMIEDREERTRCAFAIADTMRQLFPAITDTKKIWDHINIMSRFELDIDFPVEVVTREQLRPKAERIPYNSSLNRFRHYGKSIQDMIRKVAEMDNCVEKDRQIFLLANQMKKLLLSHNPETVSDDKVFRDIAEISGGKIMIDPASYTLNEYIGITPTEGQKGKKKKK